MFGWGLNEGIWSNLKRSLANLAKQDTGQLTALVRIRGLRRICAAPAMYQIGRRDLRMTRGCNRRAGRTHI